MNTHRIQFCCIAAFFVTALLSSCVKESQPDRQTVPDGEPVEVSLNLTADHLVEMTLTGTKGTGINDTTNPEVNDIKNLWILQFDGTGDDALRRGNPMYIENYNPSELLKLIASNAKNRLVFVANTFAATVAFGDCRTLADAKALIRSVTLESDVVRTDTVGGIVKHYPVLNGHQDLVVNSGIAVSATLTHSVARIDVKVVNAIPDSLTIESVTMKSVPDRFNYITDYDLPELYPDAATLSTVDYAPTPWTEGGIDGGDANRRNFSFYVPANKRGTTTEDSNGGKYKGFFAPDKASYAFIQAYYYEGTGASAVKRSVSYSFYLGADLTNDYNIKPNGHYSYTFTINRKGNEDYDGRVEDTGTVNLRNRELANCYIINPPAAEGIWRNYQIPVKRVWEFWKADGRYEDNNDYALLSTSNGWVVDVIWSEFPIDSTHFKWVKRNKIEGLDPENDYFEFSVKSGVSGNCVVGIRRYANQALLIDDIYLWSWHLWVTDYKPDKASAYTINPSDGRYVYKVPGGDVHRYNNAIFNTGIYAGKVIMDRNLGAKDIYYHSNYDRYLYYQFGRKDPFSGPRKIYIRHDHDESPSTYDYETWSTATYTIQNTAADANLNNVPYSIHNPLTFIKGEYWTYKDKYNPTTYDGNIRWQDPEVKTDAGKSIFDPCPPGWKMPKDGTWAGFDTKADNKFTKFLLNDPLSPGRNYFPNGSSDRSTGTIFFPASGYLDSGSGAFSRVGGGGHYWSCSPLSAAFGSSLNFYSGAVYPSNTNLRASGFPVRCVQE